MHPNPVYRGADAAKNLDFARSRGFGVLTIAGPSGPLASHVPFVISDDGAVLGAHLVRSNPLWRALAEPQKALMIVSGPDGYISPDWYGIEDQVPTWNYIAVHLRGTISRLPDAALHEHLVQLSASHEAKLAPKPEWKIDKMSDGVAARMMRMIAPVEVQIETVEGTWKLSQNKAAGVPTLTAAEVAQSGVGMELTALAAAMRAIDKPAK